MLLTYPLMAGWILLSSDGWAINRLNLRIWQRTLGPLDLLQTITPEQFADGMNVVLFVPFFLALAVLVPTWWWVLVGLALSAGVELYQARLDGTRIPEAIDVVTNTLGALLGVALGRWIMGALRSRDARAHAAGAARGPSGSATPPAAPASTEHGPAGGPDDRD